MPILDDHGNGLILNVRIQPRSSANRIVGILDDALKIKLTAPPINDAANRLCIQYLAKHLGLAKSSMTIISGRTNRNKRILIQPDPKKDPSAEKKRIEQTLSSLLRLP